MNEKDLQDAACVLNKIFVWKYNSLARYIVDARPFVDQGQEPLLAVIEAQAEEDERFAKETVALLESFGSIAKVRPYDHHVSELNYLSISYLKNVLKEQLEKQLAFIDQTLRETRLPSEAGIHLEKAQNLWNEQIRQLEAA